mgnify:FL=1
MGTQIWSSGWQATGYTTDRWGGTVHACTWVVLDSKNTSTRTATLTAYCDMNYTSATGNYVYNSRGWDVHVETPGGTANSSVYTQLDYGTSYAISKQFTINYDNNGNASFSIHGWCDGPYDADVHMYSETLTLSGSTGIDKAEQAPPAPTDVKAVLSGNSNCAITWKHVGGTSSKPLAGFWIDKGEDEGAIQSSNVNTKEDASQRSFTYAGAVNKRYCFRVWAHGNGGSAYTDTPNFVYTKPAAITSATGGNLYFWQSANIFDVFVKCDRSAIKWPGKAQVQLYAGGAWQSTIYDAITGTSGDVKISSTTAVTALTSVFNSIADNSSNTTAIKGRVRYANADNSAYSDWKEFTITTHKVKTAQMYVAAGGKTAAYTYTKDSSGKITKITPNFSVNFRDDSGKGAYTYTKDNSGKITKTTPNMVISYAK